MLREREASTQSKNPSKSCIKGMHQGVFPLGKALYRMLIVAANPVAPLLQRIVHADLLYNFCNAAACEEIFEFNAPSQS